MGPLCLPSLHVAARVVCVCFLAGKFLCVCVHSLRGGTAGADDPVARVFLALRVCSIVYDQAHTSDAESTVGMALSWLPASALLTHTHTHSGTQHTHHATYTWCYVDHGSMARGYRLLSRLFPEHLGMNHCGHPARFSW